LNPPTKLARQELKGFTLVELIAVMGIIVIIMALLVPAVGTLVGSKGRQGALNRLIGTFDRARIAALETSGDVYIGFADSTFPVPEMRYRSYIIFRKRTETDTPPAGPSASPYVFLTKWETLPQGISIKSEQLSLVGNSGSLVTVSNTDSFPRISSGAVPTIVFNASGAVAGPVESKFLKLLVYEGFYEGNRDVLTHSSGLFDLITLSRFTGRARLEVSSSSGGNS